jgi:K+-sensing histidine kinase KdpD
MSKRTIIIFSFFVVYIVFQFLWWEILLVKQSNEIISEKQNIAALSSTDFNLITRDIALLEDKKVQKIYMIVGEGSVFLLILLFGVYLVRKSIRKEIEVSSQQKNFILSVSHELKTPIAAAKLQLQTLLKHQLSREQQEKLLTNALNETERLHQLVDNVLLANQIENHNLSIRQEAINLGELIEQTTSRYYSQYINEGMIHLKIQSQISINGNKDLLPSVIINLIDNAIKYSFDKISIKVVLESVNDDAVLKIIDCGVGVLEKEKEKIFDKFFRSGHEETRRTKGTGIGLFIVKRICDLHHAKIQLFDNKPQGSVFQITFKALK